MHSQPPSQVISILIVLFFGIGIHEYAHCKFADLAGDPTPRYYGRVTLNLTKHFEPMGTILMVVTAFAGYGLGWGKPAPMMPEKMKNPRWDFFIAVAAGPISNVCQAIVYAFFYRLLTSHPNLAGSYDTLDAILNFLYVGLQVNLALFFFNLIPFGPLDGHWLVGLLIPEKPRLYWYRFNRQIGFPGLIVVVVLLQFMHISPLTKPVTAAERVLLGPALTS